MGSLTRRTKRGPGWMAPAKLKRLRAAVRRGESMMVNGELVGPERLARLLETGALPPLGAPEAPAREHLRWLEVTGKRFPVRVE